MSFDITLDYTHMMAPNIGTAEGLSETELNAVLPELRWALDWVAADRSRADDGAQRHKELGFWDLPDTMPAQLPAIQAAADQLAAAADAHVILGIGGSYLGARMLFEALCHRYHNELPRARRNQRPRIYFEGNGLDTDSLGDLMDLLGNDDVTIEVVSKSGSTLETASAFRLLRHFAGTRAKGWALTTDPGSNLEKLGDALKLPGLSTFHMPANVGGRYSVLTSVGLLPAAVMGLNIERLIDGARQMRERCLEPTLENPACLYAALQYLSLRHGRKISVMAVWEKALEGLGLWYDQLSAESLGKVEKGRTPLTAVCTRELHSRGQQHQEGTRDKVITNIVIDSARRKELFIQRDPSDDQPVNEGLGYVVGKTIHTLNENAYLATDTAYATDGRPGMTLRLGKLDEEHLGGLIFLFELATVIEGRLMHVNPLNQPGVQGYKNFLQGLLGNPSLQRYAEQFKRREAGEQPFGR